VKFRSGTSSFTAVTTWSAIWYKNYPFDICPSFCVTWLWTWQKSQLWRDDRQSHTGLIY